MRVIRFVLGLFLLILFSLSFVSAQSQTLTYGESLTIDLNDSTIYRFDFAGNADDQIYLSAFSSSYIPLMMRLFGVNGTLLAESDNNGFGVVLGPYTLTNTGNYLIELQRPDWASETGVVSLFVDLAVINPVKVDGLYTGSLSRAGAAAFFQFSGQSDQLFGYSVRGSDLLLSITDETGNNFIRDTDESFFVRPLAQLPRSGDFTVFLQTAAEGTDYELRLLPVSAELLEENKTLSGTFSEDQPKVFRFRANADTLWRIATEIPNADYDVALSIYRVSDVNNAIDRDTGSFNGVPRIDPFAAPESGEYLIVLTADNGDDTIDEYDYTITLSPSQLVILQSGTPVEGNINSDDGIITYLYRGQVDQTVRITLITVETSQGLPRMTVYSPEDLLLDYGSRSRGSATFEVTLPLTGLYRFDLQNIAYQASDLNFTLTVEVIP
ncbi:MAG: hypothetical protein MUF87_06550 [Anaerolineae bacterium]|jgi:hypothetical protein|nr:hypothetical protein [Anaerolineae bacterium]